MNHLPLFVLTNNIETFSHIFNYILICEIYNGHITEPQMDISQNFTLTNLASLIYQTITTSN